MQSLPRDELERVWIQHHQSKDNILVAVIPAETYTLFHARTRAYPLFTLPIPRQEGVEFFLAQHDGHVTHMTSLLEYKIHRESALPYLTLVHYTDYLDKGVVLMHGEISTRADGTAMLSRWDARYLAMDLQRWYITDTNKLKLVQKFTSNPSEVDVEEIIEASKVVE
jgi:ATP synthase F1 complex assembly factor 1